MMSNIEVSRIENDLRHETWTFWFDDSRGWLILNEYRKWERTTKRHKHITVAFFHRIDGRNNTVSIDQVPWSDDIASQALHEFMKRIRILKERP